MENKFTCQYCGKDTSTIDVDYLNGFDHLSCVLEVEMREKGEYDTCVMCGVETPYKRNVHIDMRTGYLEGVGQLCSRCSNQESDPSYVIISRWIIENTPNDQELGGKVRELYWESKK